MNKELNEEIVSMSFEIILKAGDARTDIQAALDLAKENNFELAEQKMEIAKKNITEAHVKQTSFMQKECNGEAVEFQVIFAHALDTMMTINSEYLMAKKLIEILHEIDKRIGKLEV